MPPVESSTAPPGKSLLDLPGEIRNLVYDFMKTSKRASTNTDSDFIPANLLLINRQIHQETRSLLYGQTRFKFTSFHDGAVLKMADTLSPGQQVHVGHSVVYGGGMPFDYPNSPDNKLVAFLEQIGPGNGRCIKDIQIAFPSVFQEGDRIEIDSLTSRAFDKLQVYCPNLKKLRLGCESVIFSGEYVHAHYFICSGRIHSKVLDLVAACLRAISSEMEVEFNMFTDCDCLARDEFKMKIESYGWKVNILYKKSAIRQELFLPIYLGDSDLEDSHYDDSYYEDSSVHNYDDEGDSVDFGDTEIGDSDSGDHDDEGDSVGFEDVESDDSG
ncbi:uncharacterized protein N7496_012244 [Penicillium cataractarum]|uniref:Uncharacterized protein n=1 Tax=Penicillium cataractarum TaxID=2100454 RepID=A0A9W9URU4_9EURO|nr:uncharacterized protein N7496_012244 [Penicillium cataractarum]KAJ5355032.1 hypothetical protein N7496_012244 [Penicillium cataractarum]